MYIIRFVNVFSCYLSLAYLLTNCQINPDISAVLIDAIKQHFCEFLIH